jgi:flavodoxin I
MNIKIIYETQTGTTQYVAEVIQAELSQKGHQVQLHSIKYDGLNPSTEGMEVLIFGAPTYDDGKLEKTMKGYVDQAQIDLSKFKVVVFGLGNRTYPQFCMSADMLEKWVQDHQGKLISETLRVDGFPDDLNPILNWVRTLQSKL